MPRRCRNSRGGIRSVHRVTILAGIAAVALSVPSAHAQTGKPPVPVIPASLKLASAADPPFARDSRMGPAPAPGPR